MPPNRTSWPVFAVFAALVVLVWPLQAVVVGMFLAFVVLSADAYAVWMDRRPVDHAPGPAKRRALDQRALFGLVTALVLGTVATLLAPETTGLVAIGLVLAATVASSLVRALVARPPSAAVAGAVDTNEPGFWAGPPPDDLAPVAPMPEPRPQPVPARAASPRAARAPSPRPRRPSPAPTRQPVATRRRSRARV